MDLFTKAKIRSLSKYRSRTRARTQKLIDTQQYTDYLQQLAKQKKIRELIEQIKALQIINGDTSEAKKQLNTLLKH